MVKRARQFPDVGELVYGKIVRVTPFSVFVELEEYPGKEGMVHVSEVARKWIKDIRNFAREGQRVVCVVLRVEQEKGFITLSMKRVDKRDEIRKMKDVKNEQRAEKMLEQAAKEIGLDLEAGYKEAGFKLQEEFGSMFSGFELASTAEGRSLLLKRGFDKKWVDSIGAVAEKAMEPKEVDLKGFVDAKSYASDGVDVVKSILIEAEAKFDIGIRCISAPKYVLELKTKDAKTGERKIREVGTWIVSRIEASGGEGKLEEK